MGNKFKKINSSIAELNKTNTNLNNLNKAYIVKIIEEYTIKSIFPNVTNIVVQNAVNSQKLQNKNIGVTPGSIVNIQENGKIYSNIIFTKGMIIAWFGTKNEVPENWVICDGTNGTPDLRDKFILGTDDAKKIGTKGGQSKITLSKSNLPKMGEAPFSCESFGGAYHKSSNGLTKFQSSYSTRLKGGGNPDDWGSNILIDLNEGFDASPIDIMNPYYALFYIMKL